ncbi:MAG: sugar isomerase domain-containing protein [Oscillospiraceae bacterium]|nr:sugar isomerase domain-containing protein [Oscillospiraceae bacterium]
MSDQFGYLDTVVNMLRQVEETQSENIRAAAALMADAIAKDKLIHVYAGGGHTTLCMGEMFFRAGGLACINPMMETGLSVFNQALKYLEFERTVNYGAAIVRYFKLQEGDVLIIFHNIGINPATIDAAMQAKEDGAKIIAVSSSHWQLESPEDSPIRHPSKKNLFDFADVCIDDLNPLGDAVTFVDGVDEAMAPTSNIIDFYIAHRLELECAAECVKRDVEVPVWRSANAKGGDEANKVYLDKYMSRIKML